MKRNSYETNKQSFTQTILKKGEESKLKNKKIKQNASRRKKENRIKWLPTVGKEIRKIAMRDRRNMERNETKKIKKDCKKKRMKDRKKRKRILNETNKLKNE